MQGEVSASRISVLSPYQIRIHFSVFIRDCSDCRMIIACQQYRTRDCKNFDTYLLCQTQPIIEASAQMRFGCMQLNYDHFEGPSRTLSGPHCNADLFQNTSRRLSFQYSTTTGAKSTISRRPTVDITSATYLKYVIRPLVLARTPTKTHHPILGL